VSAPAIAASPLPLDSLFQVANTAALLSWIALIVLPRTRALSLAIGGGTIGAMCVLYAVLIQMHFFDVPGGGFGSLPAVQRLFESPAVALAGWLHFLAFDLFVGLWIAKRADAIGVSRWLQAPVLATTFMFGPIGLLAFGAVLGVRRLRGAPRGAA
jgi:hypothetical protein